MNQKNTFNKDLAFAIILLFIGVALAPSINASVVNEQNNILKEDEENDITFLVRKFKSDGNIEKYTVQISRDKVNNYYGEIKNANTLNERLEIHKTYGLIPYDVTADDMRSDFNQKIDNFDYSNISMKNISSPFNQYERFVLVKNSMCSVWGFAGGIQLYFGLSSLTSRLNYLIWDKFGSDAKLLPSIDIGHAGLCLGGVMETTDGNLPDSKGYFLPLMFFFICGFVGYVISELPTVIYRLNIFEGYSGFVLACGINLLGEPYI